MSRDSFPRLAVNLETGNSIMIMIKKKKKKCRKLGKPIYRGIHLVEQLERVIVLIARMSLVKCVYDLDGSPFLILGGDSVPRLRRGTARTSRSFLLSRMADDIIPTICQPGNSIPKLLPRQIKRINRTSSDTNYCPVLGFNPGITGQE